MDADNLNFIINMGCCINSSTKLGEAVFDLSELEDYEEVEKRRTHKMRDLWQLDSSSSIIVLEVVQDTSMNSQMTSARISLF